MFEKALVNSTWDGKATGNGASLTFPRQAIRVQAAVYKVAMSALRICGCGRQTRMLDIDQSIFGKTS